MNTEQRRKRLANEILNCHMCDGMNEPQISEALPGWGDVRSRVMIVGQSLCRQCMDAKEPFYQHSGDYITRAVELAGKRKKDVFITNLVHCHPPGNRKSHRDEIDHCKGYLHRELDIVKPILVVGLGKDAKAELKSYLSESHELSWPLAKKPSLRPKDSAIPYLLFPEHPGSLRFKHTADRQYWAPSLARAIRWAFDVC